MADINYFRLSWDEVKKLLKKKKSVQVNQNQCRLLTEKLVETLRTVRAYIYSLSPWKQSLFCKQQCKGALQELYRVTREAEELVRACCNKDQLNIAAVKLVNNTESFAASFFRLEWCAAVIHIVTSDATADTSSSNLRRKIMIEGFSTVEQCESTMQAIRGMLKEAALEDHRSLMKRLLEKCGRRNEDEQVQQLIANMLELDPTQESSTCDSNKKKGASLKLPSIESAQFESFRKIGAGSSCTVFEVSWLGQKFAMKTGLRTVTHETEISAGLSHPHIVRVFGVSTNKRHSCNLVMELMSGDLYDYIYTDHPPPYDLDIAVDIMLQIAEGMQYLHDKQIVHRDLKSSNILVDPVDCSGKGYLRVKVADFGLAEIDCSGKGYLRVKEADFGLAKIKAASATYSLQSMNVGTTRWMAPELLTSSDQRESSEPTPQELRYPFMVDVYSYAITCSEILAGDLPFNAEMPSNLRERVKDGLRPQLPASVPPCLVSLIQRCWDAEASRRPKFSEICVELRHLKASLMVGGEQLVRALQSPTSVSPIEDSLWRHPSLSSEVPQKLPNIIEGIPFQYLDLAANSLMRIQISISPKSANPIPINELQCQYLWVKLCETLKGAKACIQDASLQHIQESHDTLKTLAGLAKEAEKLVHDCCDAEWIQAAMIFANAKEHFASLTFKLRLYMELLQSIFEEGATKEFLTKLQDQKWIDDVKDEEVHFIDEKAKEDRQRLLSRLIHIGSSDSENLIRRLHIFFNRANFLQDNATSVIGAWKVEYKSIHRVPNGQIGKGGSATIHKVTWLGKDFAAKCFHGPENEDIQKEASLLVGLSHPNILPMFCYATRDHSCSLIMELMDEDLHSLMMRRLGNEETLDAPFKLLEAVDIMLQVAEGMNYLHQNRVVHRDLKSMNILVKYNEHDRHVYAKVADFGLSIIKELSCTYSNLKLDLGTTRWMAPELFHDSEDQNVGPSLSTESGLSLKYHFKVDVYSFGMVCYEILTGRVPFFNYFKLMDLRKRIKDGLRPDLPKQCPEQLSALVQACYHPNPKARPSFRDICVELRHIMCLLMVDSTS